MPLYDYARETPEGRKVHTELFWPSETVPETVTVDGEEYTKMIPGGGGYNKYQLSSEAAEMRHLTGSAMNQPQEHLYFENKSPADAVRDGTARLAGKGRGY